MSDTSVHKIIKQGYESYVTAGWEQLLCKIDNFHTDISNWHINYHASIYVILPQRPTQYTKYYGEQTQL